MTVEAVPPGPVDLDAVDLSDRDWWAGPPSVRYATFAALAILVLGRVPARATDVAVAAEPIPV